MLTITYCYDGIAASTITLAETASAQTQTAAIQSALDAVAGHAGAEVTLSAGTFTLTGTGKAADGALRIGSETTLGGAGMGSTVLRLADGSTAVTGMIRTDSGRTLPDGSATTTSNVTIHDLTLDGNKANTSGNTDGFYCGPKPGTAQADTNIMLDHVEIANVSRYGFDPHEQTVGLSIINSVAHDNGVDGFTIDFCSDVLIANNVAYGNGRHGFNIVTGSHGVTLLDNDAHDNGGNGITVQTGDNEIRGWTEGVTITGGVVTHNGGDGIDVHQARDVTIEGVSISDNGTDGISLAGVENVTVSANAITGVHPGHQAVHIAGYLQDFGDTDALNDQYIGTHGVTVDGVGIADIGVPAGLTGWSYDITAGNDSVTGSAGRDTIAAGSGNDTVNGGAGDDAISGNDGNDVLDGGAGCDKLYGGMGDDVLKAGLGLDTLDGGAGFDSIDFSKFGSAVAVDLTAGRVTAGGVTLAQLTSIEAVTGTSQADTLIGDAKANRLDGGGSYDRLEGGSGNDSLFGGAGNDTLVGGAGNDAMTGGTGSDRFLFAGGFGTDTVLDFTRGGDKIDLTAFADITSIAQLGISQGAGGADITVGADHIVLAGVQAWSLTASDFILHA